MLIRTAAIGYGREPDFEVNPPNAPLTEERIAHAMLHLPVFREAFKREGIDPDDQLLASLVRKGERQREQRVRDRATHQRQPGVRSRL